MQLLVQTLLFSYEINMEMLLFDMSVIRNLARRLLVQILHFSYEMNKNSWHLAWELLVQTLLFPYEIKKDVLLC